jgi:hypothetical protein
MTFDLRETNCRGIWLGDRMRTSFVTMLVLLVTTVWFEPLSTAQSIPLDFADDVLPILSKNCFPCHGPDETSRQADLRLDSREGALRGDKPAIIPGQSGASLLIERIASRDPEQRMPPPDAERQLSEHEIETLRLWIDGGAAWGEHWSFRPLKSPRPPAIDVPDFSQGPIDRFILSRLDRAGLKPSPVASKEVLLRRLAFDLVGLPPSRQEQLEFAEDCRPDQFERLVDRLQASPHFGERWGRHWLDAARYADSAGFEGDPPRSIWKYRDWVLNAFNQDLAFDEFVIKQLAGDLLPDSTIDDRIATGFLLNSQVDGGSEPSRLDAVVDRVNTIGSVFLGMTLGCAQCHTHKFDPISQSEYYGLFAFVNSADERKLEFAIPEQIARRDAITAQVATLTAERTSYAATLPAEKSKTDPGFLERTATIESLTSRIPNFESTLVLQNGPADRITTTFVRGEFSRPGEVVMPDVPRVLPPLSGESRTRLDLARWLVSPTHPLTARVTVNRMWQQLFGRGLVETESDFGTQGSRPTHPELLDWLAAEFVHYGWQTKSMLRSIVSSGVYRQSSVRRDDLDIVDPGNRLLARQSRLRLEAEVIRDCALSVSGLLSNKVGGPSIFPFQHDGIMINRATPAPWTMSGGEDRYRRGMYTYYWRLTPHPLLQTFDAPDAITTCTRRQTSNTPLQALTLLNDPTFVEAATQLARIVLKQPQGDEDSDEKRVNRLCEVCLSRSPSIEERTILMSLLAQSRQRFATEDQRRSLNINDLELKTWAPVARAFLNLEEFIVRE